MHIPRSKLIKKQVLHVGCGSNNNKNLHKMFLSPDWQEIRIDIDPSVKPDIVTDIRNLGTISDASVDAVYSSHNIEHLHAFEVNNALQEFKRVLKHDGFALITCPDLQAVALQICKGNLDKPLYSSPVGEVAPIDIIFGHRACLEKGMKYMAHKTGFTAVTLGKYLLQCGFAHVKVSRNTGNYSLWAIAYKSKSDTRHQTSNT